MSAKDVQTNIRIPEELKTRLIEAAKANQRSMGSEIVARLQLTFDQDPALGFMTPNQRKAILASPGLLEGLERGLMERLQGEVQEISKKTILDIWEKERSKWSEEQAYKFAQWHEKERAKEQQDEEEQDKDKP